MPAPDRAASHPTTTAAGLRSAGYVSTDASSCSIAVPQLDHHEGKAAIVHRRPAMVNVKRDVGPSTRESAPPAARVTSLPWPARDRPCATSRTHASPLLQRAVAALRADGTPRRVFCVWECCFARNGAASGSRGGDCGCSSNSALRSGRRAAPRLASLRQSRAGAPHRLAARARARRAYALQVTVRPNGASIGRPEQAFDAELGDAPLPAREEDGEGRPTRDLPRWSDRRGERQGDVELAAQPPRHSPRRTRRVQRASTKASRAPVSSGS